jgi:hypothetical protein
MKVMVFDAKDPEIPIGMGDLCRTEDIQIASDEDMSRIVCTIKDHPVIVMEETGDILYGIECWWCPV